MKVAVPMAGVGSTWIDRREHEEIDIRADLIGCGDHCQHEQGLVVQPALRFGLAGHTVAMRACGWSWFSKGLVADARRTAPHVSGR